MKTASEFDNFDRTMHEIIKVPHGELKAKLEMEKKVKKRKKTKKSSSSDRA